MQFPDFKNEIEHLGLGYDFVAGCDEVGRGPLAGPVVACACILDATSIDTDRRDDKWYSRVRDSKSIRESEREKLAGDILKHVVAYGIGEVGEEEIDNLNIHNATLLAMRRATEEMLSKIDKRGRKIIMLVDGKFKIPEINIEQKNIVKGDTKILSISAASIIAKVHRDNLMKKLGEEFPEYGFAKHKGYGTKEHQGAIKNFGPTVHHRQSFLKKVL